MGKRKYVLVIDVEGTRKGFAYDIGCAICDLNGEVYASYSAIVAEVFFGKWQEMHTAYYADKIPEYGARVVNRNTQIKGIETIRYEILEMMKEYGVATVAAYNVAYDKGALNRTITDITDGYITEFFPSDITVWDIWGMACETILQRKAYKNMAVSNGWISEKGNIKSSAECAYRYISDNKAFEEEHMGLDDVLIEILIMAATIATKKKMKRIPIPCPWKLIQEIDE